jgi:hypothetical protein
MKDTVFMFGLRMRGQESSALEKIKEQLVAISGVTAAETKQGANDIELCVRVTFSSPEQAKIAHRAVMRKLLSMADTVVTKAVSNLTEVFG